MPKLNVGSAEAQAEAELKFTETLLTYARHAMIGRVHFSRVSPNIEYKLAFDADDVLKKIAASNDLPKTLEQFNPQQPAYKALKAKLAELRSEPAESGPPRIENGPVLRYARDRNGRETVMTDPRVPQLRERLGLAGRAEHRTTTSRSPMRSANSRRRNGMQATGQLNGADHRGAQRAEPRQADRRRPRHAWSAGAGCRATSARTHVVLNIPDFNLRVYNDGAQGLADARRGRQADAGRRRC